MDIVKVFGLMLVSIFAAGSYFAFLDSRWYAAKADVIRTDYELAGQNMASVQQLLDRLARKSRMHMRRGLTYAAGAVFCLVITFAV